MVEKDAKVKSLEKALKILECFNSNNPELGIAQIAEMLGLNKSNVHNIVSTFEKLGYLEQNNESKRYRLGFKMLEYTYIINNNLSYQKVLYEIISEVANETSCIVYFAIPKEDRIFYLNNAYPSGKNKNSPYRIIMGETAPYYCTSLGKGMLAHFEKERIDYLLSLERKKFTRNTIIDEQELRDELHDIREKGYAIDDCEHELGVKCMSMPIITRKCTVVGAVSISTSVTDFEDEKINEYVKILSRATRELRDLFN